MVTGDKPISHKRQVIVAGMLCLATLFSAGSFCVGCTIHETNRWGQSQDGLTHLLALGTYLSLAAFVLSVVLFLAVTVRMVFQRRSK